MRSPPFEVSFYFRGFVIALFSSQVTLLIFFSSPLCSFLFFARKTTMEPRGIPLRSLSGPSSLPFFSWVQLNAECSLLYIILEREEEGELKKKVLAAFGCVLKIAPNKPRGLNPPSRAGPDPLRACPWDCALGFSLF